MLNVLSIRVDASNPDHHLWNNHGVWWIHYTVLIDGVRQRRVRRSLGTRDREEARERRDRILARPPAPDRGPGDPRLPDSSPTPLEPRLVPAAATTGGLLS